MDVFKYCSQLMGEPNALWEPPLDLKEIEELPRTLMCTFSNGTKGCCTWYAPTLRTWTNAQVVDAIKMTLAYPKVIEVVSPYKLSAADTEELKKIGATIFSSPEAQTEHASVVVKVTLKDSTDRMRRLVLNALLSI